MAITITARGGKMAGSTPESDTTEPTFEPTEGNYLVAVVNAGDNTVQDELAVSFNGNAFSELQPLVTNVSGAPDLHGRVFVWQVIASPGTHGVDYNDGTDSANELGCMVVEVAGAAGIPTGLYLNAVQGDAASAAGVLEGDPGNSVLAFLLREDQGASDPSWGSPLTQLGISYQGTGGQGDIWGGASEGTEDATPSVTFGTAAYILFTSEWAPAAAGGGSDLVTVGRGFNRGVQRGVMRGAA